MANEGVTTRDRASNRQQLPEEVAAYVRELIVSGEARPGEFLRVDRIAEAVGVSNTPVREGLLALQSEGFVELVPRRGFIVSAFTRQDVLDLFWAQAQLARELAARAAKKISPEQVDQLQLVLDQFDKAAKADDQERLAELGHAFHRGINLAADSHRLALLLGSVVRHLPNRFYAAVEAQVSVTSDDHQMLLDALRNRDSRKARTIMERHTLARGDHLIALLEERGLWGDHGWGKGEQAS
jgi:DNA-binding GntR family transcriptional regulator